MGDIKGGILDVLTDGTPERVEVERNQLESLVHSPSEVPEETTPDLDFEEYEVIECEHGEVIDIEHSS